MQNTSNLSLKMRNKLKFPKFSHHEKPNSFFITENKSKTKKNE